MIFVDFVYILENLCFKVTHSQNLSVLKLSKDKLKLLPKDFMY